MKDLGSDNMENVSQGYSADTDRPESERKKARSFIKALLPRTLLGRSLLILVTPILIIQIVSAVVFLDNHWKKMLDRLAYAVAGEISMIARAIDDNMTPEDIKRMKSYVSQNLGLLVSYEVGGNLDEKDFSGRHAIWESVVVNTLSRELESQLRRPFYIHADFREKWVEVNIQLEGGVLNVVLPERRLFSSSGYIFLIWMFTTSLVIFAVAVVFMRNQIRPIRRLAVAAEWFGRGRDVQKFKLEGASEVRQAGQAFLDMRRRINRQMSQRAFMLAGISHDLRTPLTRMKLELEMMGQSDAVEALKGDVLQMQKMIDGYLDFVRGEGREQLVNVMLSKITDKMRGDFERQGCSVEWRVPDYIQIPLRPVAFERAMSNIISNACKYGDQVWVSADVTKDERAEIRIEDNGPGIPEDKYDEVFKPFYRMDGARSLDTGGVGLGLPIAMDIIHSHGGRIWLEKSAHGGLKVVIRIPL